MFQTNKLHFQQPNQTNKNKNININIPTEIKRPFITCFLMGGLGNQLFQIFCTMAFALKHNYDYIFPYSETLNTGITRPTYWDTLFKTIKFKTTDAQQGGLTEIPRYNEVRLFKYYPIPPSAATGLLIGYFQSYRYFFRQYDKIISILNIREQQQNIKNKYLITDGNVIGYFVSMHFRIGDYVLKQDYHPVMNYDYYERSLNYILTKNIIKNIQDTTVLYFCESENNKEVEEMINKLSQKFGVCFIKTDDNISDWEQMLLMSCCQDHIIANSTFSWWGAYLNKNKDKIVCYPKNWLGVKLLNEGYDIKDLIPMGWIEL